MASQIRIGTKVFASKAAAKRFYKGLLRRYSHDVAHLLEGPDAADVIELLQHHEDAANKIGPGIAWVGVKQLERNAYSFVVGRVDNTEDHFSYRNCLGYECRLIDPFRAAGRTAIAADVAAFKREHFRAQQEGNGCVTCQATGAMIPFADAHVDHAEPKTFAALVDSYIVEHGVDLETVAYKDLDMGGKRFEDEAEAERFRAWHQANAVLRVISAAENLRTACRGRRVAAAVA